MNAATHFEGVGSGGVRLVDLVRGPGGRGQMCVEMILNGVVSAEGNEQSDGEVGAGGWKRERGGVVWAGERTT